MSKTLTQKDLEVKRLPGKPTIKSPLKGFRFVHPESRILLDTDLRDIKKRGFKDPLSFTPAGPYKKNYFDKNWAKPILITCGGNSPGFNVVTHGVTRAFEAYGVPYVTGGRYGYKSLNPKYGYKFKKLRHKKISHILQDAAPYLSTSRGKQDPKVMVDTLFKNAFNILICVGGDGTLSGAHQIHQEIQRRKLPISVIGIPKTIDNDIVHTDMSFGFQTAVIKACERIQAAYCEAVADGSVMVVKIFGRDSGAIVAAAAEASGLADIVLVPEMPFTMNKGPNAVLPMIRKTLKKKGSAVVVVAEGAGQELLGRKSRVNAGNENVVYGDILSYVVKATEKYFKKHSIDALVKFMEPKYSIRGGSPIGMDASLCTALAYNAVDVAMAGFTDCYVSRLSDHIVVPLSLLRGQRKNIESDSLYLQRVMHGTAWNV